MENLSTLEIVGIIVLVLLFGGVIWKIAKRLVGILIVGAIIILGIYFVKPDLIDEWFGKETRIEMENKVKKSVEELKPHVKDGIKKIKEGVENMIESIDSVEKKM